MVRCSPLESRGGQAPQVFSQGRKSFRRQRGTDDHVPNSFKQRTFYVGSDFMRKHLLSEVVSDGPGIGLRLDGGRGHLDETYDA